ncbi:hypothetical protein predicted by Glimmer/Critica [Sorangium cellulosum So ce56]|uniref:Uncharacterized protein n=2 Tax=Sorangium cellulosum TaxID=56 RepID=A9GK34_SORC5|nr:hypothetical protein predicted by Glimmer/Critica [Sorangium cellulosum So ce56]
MFVLHVMPRLGPAERAMRSPRPSMEIAAAVLRAVMVAIPLWAAGCDDQDDASHRSDDAGEQAGAVAAVFLSQDEGRIEISRRDEYVAEMNRFDLQLRTGSLEPVTVDDYLRAMPPHVLEFSEGERQRVTAALSTVLDRMAATGLKPPEDPAEVQLVRTDGKEEGDALAYTRSASIFLCDGLFTMEDALFTHVIAHELFHVWSRANPDVVRWPTHEALGFVRAEDISFPASLAERRITNPDDPKVHETIHVQLDGKPVEVFLAIMASKDYEGGSLLDYIQLELIEPASAASHPLDSAQGLFEQIGTTTPEILSAEEISAEHFAIGLLQDRPINDPELIEAVLRPFAQ